MTYIISSQQCQSKGKEKGKSNNYQHPQEEFIQVRVINRQCVLKVYDTHKQNAWHTIQTNGEVHSTYVMSCT